jgi:hypothetical protein
MDPTERQVIDDLFAKLRQAEQQAGPRDGQAEQHIGTLLRDHPAAPYYMAQAIVVQEHALKAAQARIEQLERELTTRPAAGAAGGGSFLGGLFGGGTATGQPGRVPPPPPNPQLQSLQRYGQRGPWGGGVGSSFLGGAMQTAMGVAGGLVLGNLLMSAFDGGEAMAAEAVQDLGNEVLPQGDPTAEDAAFDDAGMGDAGDFEGEI